MPKRPLHCCDWQEYSMHLQCKGGFPPWSVNFKSGQLAVILPFCCRKPPATNGSGDMKRMHKQPDQGRSGLLLDQPLLPCGPAASASICLMHVAEGFQQHCKATGLECPTPRGPTRQMEQMRSSSLQRGSIASWETCRRCRTSWRQARLGM